MSVKVNYKGEEILSVNTDTTKTLKTSGKYCEGDIEVINTQDGGITPSGTISITENGTYDVTEKAEAVVNVSGGGGIFHEIGNVSVHTGTNVLQIKIPVSNSSYNHYAIRLKGTKSWLKVDGVWTEQNTIDFTGLTAAQYAVLTLQALYPTITTPEFTVETGTTISAGAFGASSVTIAVPIATGSRDYSSSAKVTLDNSEFTVKSSHNFCAATWGMTYEYEVWGWNDA